MKRVSIFVICMLAMMMVLSGCSSNGKPASNSDVDASPVKDATGKELPAQVKAIYDRGVLRVGTKVDVPGFGYQNPETQVVEGFEIDLAKLLAKRILGDETKIETQGVTAKTRGPLLDSGEVDMIIATFTVNEERKKSYNFTTPYFVDTVGLLVKKDVGIASLADLDGKTIGVAQSATSKDAIQAEADKLGVNVSFSEFASYPEIKAALSSGRVDAFSVDKSILYGYLDDNTVILPDSFSPQDYGIATKFDNKELAGYLEEVIKELQASGELDTLIEKWGIR